MDISEDFNVYKDINARTKGEIYIGVVGPVRTGKSTFIKRFMDLLVLPNIEDVHSKERTRDELPQSAAGVTIMTTEPKFIPKDAAIIDIGKDVSVAIRLIDCVGYMVKGASGHQENGEERLVKTPWFEYEIPFTKAAEIGTKKVISEHSTIGIVITTDGSFGDISREGYLEAEQQTIDELKTLGKPFVVLLNSAIPFSAETRALADEISMRNNITVLPVNCEQLKKDDIYMIMESVLREFPVTKLEFYSPKWVEMLDIKHPIKQEIIEKVKVIMNGCRHIKDAKINNDMSGEFVKDISIRRKDMSSGVIEVAIDVDRKYYYDVLSQLTGANILNEYQLINTIKELSCMRNEYSKVNSAIASVRSKGYGIVTPEKDEIILEEPEVIKSGNKYGVKIKALAPSVHFIKTDVLTEIAPIVGSEEQAKDLIEFIKENANDPQKGIWDTNIFGKTIEQIVEDGINTKISNLSDETQTKMQETLQKITNDSNRGVICIMI